jgi:hypothetical protein
MSVFPSDYDAALQKYVCKTVSNPDIPIAEAILDIFLGATVLVIISTVQV